MRYGHQNEPHARNAYIKYLHDKHHKDATVTRTGCHIDHEVHMLCCIIIVHAYYIFKKYRCSKLIAQLNRSITRWTCY